MDKERVKGKKVAVITWCNHNFGSRLQNYAVQQYLIGLGFESVTSPYGEEWYEPMPLLLEICRKIMHFALKFTKAEKRRALENRNSAERMRCFSAFSKQYMNCDPDLLFRNHNYSKLKEKYDYFVAGSDQIWHGYQYSRKELEFYFLEFADRSQRFTFAPSFGLYQFPWYFRNVFKKGLLGFDHLSIREERGAEMIKELTGQDAVVLLDPTLLVDTSEWYKILKRPSQYIDNNYILIYFIGDMPEEIENNIRAFAGHINANIVNLMDCDGDFFVHTRPDEFLYWIYHAKLVVTDSFHASIFSILFNRPFAVFDRRDCYGAKSRLDTLLSKFSLADRQYVKIKECFDSDDQDKQRRLLKIDYSQVAAVLEEEREKAKKFFEESFFGT